MKNLKIVTALNVVLLAFVLMILFSCSGIASETDSYTDLTNGVGTVREYWCDELTTEILENRGSDILVEKIIGRCLDAEGNGQIINCSDPNYNYISYKNVEGVHTGDVVLTVCIYQPNNSYTDDIVVRFDYIIGK